MVQVEVLQDAFMTLADAMVSELGECLLVEGLHMLLASPDVVMLAPPPGCVTQPVWFNSWLHVYR